MITGFEYPSAFLLLLIIPLLFLLRYMGLLKQLYFPLTIADWHGRRFRWKSSSFRVAVILSRLLWMISYAAAVCALAGPVSVIREKVYTSRGTDIMFVIDTSPSMAACDIGDGTRLDIAKRAICMLAEQEEGVALGITAVGSEAAVIVPPTLDRHSFFERLDSLVIGELGDGSALGTGLSTAVYHLVGTAAPKKCIILITDGENNAGAIHPNTAASLAVENNVSVYTLGIGTIGSVPIEYVDPRTGKVFSGYLESQFDEKALRRIADIGQGGYYSAVDMAELQAAFSSIAAQEVVAQAFYYRNTPVRYYDIALFASGCAIAMAWILRRLYLKELV